MVFQGDPNAPVGFTLGNFCLTLKNYNDPLPVGISKIKASNYVLYPNPAQDILYIEHKGKPISGYEVELYHSNGSLLVSQKIEYPQQLDIRELPSGIYLLKITDAGGQYSTHKIIKH